MLASGNIVINNLIIMLCCNYDVDKVFDIYF